MAPVTRVSFFIVLGPVTSHVKEERGWEEAREAKMNDFTTIPFRAVPK